MGMENVRKERYCIRDILRIMFPMEKARKQGHNLRLQDYFQTEKELKGN
jgi:hypothetical protein